MGERGSLHGLLLIVQMRGEEQRHCFPHPPTVFQLGLCNFEKLFSMNSASDLISKKSEPWMDVELKQRNEKELKKQQKGLQWPYLFFLDRLWTVHLVSQKLFGWTGDSMVFIILITIEPCRWNLLNHKSVDRCTLHIVIHHCKFRKRVRFYLPHLIWHRTEGLRNL